MNMYIKMDNCSFETFRGDRKFLRKVNAIKGWMALSPLQKAGRPDMKKQRNN